MFHLTRLFMLNAWFVERENNTLFSSLSFVVMKHSSFLAGALLASAPLALLVSGCGGGSGGVVNPTATPVPTQTLTPTPTSTPTPTFRPVREFYVNVAGASIVEGNSGQKALQFVVSGFDSYGEKMPLSFSYETINNTAIAGQDYISTAGQSSVVTGSTTTISVPILGDTTKESDETFTFRVFNAAGRYRETERTGTIENDD